MFGSSKKVVFSEAILDTGYSMPDILEFAESESRNIQLPGCRAEALKERRLETSIQDHVILLTSFITTANFKQIFYAI
jgi:hypothetical protein